jgi:hypothetical protein
MAWVVFDDVTRNVLGEEPGASARLEVGSGEPLAYALSKRRDCVVLLPGTASGEVLLLTVKPQHRQPKITAPPARMRKKTAEPSIHYVSGGFLGLTDEVALEESQEVRRTWWKRLFD